MGITSHSIQLLEKAISIKPDIKVVAEYGSQILYIEERPDMPYASVWYESKGIAYQCYDLAGGNNAHMLDLSKPLSLWAEHQLVTDFGQTEHIVQAKSFPVTEYDNGKIKSVYPSEIISIEEGYFWAWLNKHHLLEIGGLMVNENPLTGNWPGHGYSYINEDFYHELCKVADYEIIEVDRHPSCGNITDGWNVYSILRKTGNRFPSFEEFNKLPIFRS